MGFFSWIRNKVRESVLAGLGDAAAELDADHSGGVTELTARLKALPAPAEDAGNGRLEKYTRQVRSK